MEKNDFNDSFDETDANYKKPQTGKIEETLFICLLLAAAMICIALSIEAANLFY